MDYLKSQYKKIAGPGSYGHDGEIHPVPFYRAPTIDIARMYMNYPETGDWHSREIVARILAHDESAEARTYLEWWEKECAGVGAT